MIVHKNKFVKLYWRMVLFYNCDNYLQKNFAEAFYRMTVKQFIKIFCDT